MLLMPSPAEALRLKKCDVESFDSCSLADDDESNRLLRLESMRARNLITEEEYQRKRREILKQNLTDT